MIDIVASYVYLGILNTFLMNLQQSWQQPHRRIVVTVNVRRLHGFSCSPNVDQDQRYFRGLLQVRVIVRKKVIR